MKIAIMAPLVTAIREPQRGGSQAFVADLARGLTGRGHDVHVYAAAGSEIPGVEVIDTGIDPGRWRARCTGRPGQPPAHRAADQLGGGGRVRFPHASTPPCGRPGTTWSTITPSTRPAVRHATALQRAGRAHAAPAAGPGRVGGALRRPGRQAGQPAARRRRRVGIPGRRWRPVVQVDAILPPYPPTGSSRGRLRPGRRALFRGQAESREGSRRGDRYRPRGRTRDRCLR